MKNFFILLVFLVLSAILNAQTYQQVNVHAAPESIRVIASLGMAVDEGIYRNGIWETVLSAGEVKKLKNAGFTVDILREDYSTYISRRNKAAEQEISEINRQIRTKSTNLYQYPVPVHFELGSMGGFYSPDEVLQELDSMRLFFPNLISQKAVVGSHSTVEGRSIYYVKISNTPNQSTNKPRILYNSLIHAREPMGMQQLMFFMWYLLENYSINPDVKYLVDNLELYFIPMINPDGYAYNYLTTPAGGGLWRKNRKDDGTGNIGVDLNRNFSFKWGYDDLGSSPYPWDETYRGTGGFSEYETQDFRDFCVEKKFKMAYNYHTYADETLYPWCYITQPTPDSTTEFAFADHMMAQSGYISGTPGDILYNTNGDAMDWEYGDVTLKPKIISFTTETGNNFDGFWPIPTRIIPLSEENLYANLHAAQLTLPYAEITDIGSTISSKRDGWFPFRFNRLGLTDSIDYTITVKPLDSLLFSSTGPAKIIHYPSIQTPYTDSITYSLVPGIQIGQAYRIIWQINNGMTTFRDTVTKYYGWEMVLFNDDFSTMNNWTSNKWNVSAKAFHSSPTSLTDSPSGPYNNNTNYSVTLKTAVDVRQSPVAVIEYWVRYSIERSMDYCQLITSLNNGGIWTKQATRFTKTGSVMQDFPNPVYDGSRVWSQDRVVLNNASGGNLLAKFTICSDGNGIVKDGMYVDDFKVTVIDMSYNIIDPSSMVPGFISGPFPNPANAEVNVRYQLPGALTSNIAGLPSATSGGIVFQLFDARGLIVKEISITSFSGTLQLNVAELPAGIYLYRITGSFGTTAVKKLVVSGK